MPSQPQGLTAFACCHVQVLSVQQCLLDHLTNPPFSFVQLKLSLLTLCLLTLSLLKLSLLKLSLLKLSLLKLRFLYWV